MAFKSPLICYPMAAAAAAVAPTTSSVEMTCGIVTDEDDGVKDFRKKSKVESGIVESSMGSKNVQMGFPALPVHIPSNPFDTTAGAAGGGSVGRHHDIMINATCNKGLVLEIAKRAEIITAGGPAADHLIHKIISPAAGSGHHGVLSPLIEDEEVKKSSIINSANFLFGLKLKEGSVYDVREIGKSINVEDSKTEPGKTIEVREIKYSEEFEDGETVVYGDTTTSAGAGTSCLTRILHLPIVNDLNWKRLCVLLSSNYSRQKEKIIRQILVPYPSIDKDVLTILNDPRNAEINSLFKQLRRQVNDIYNPAYSQALIDAILSFVAYRKMSTIHPVVFAVGRAQENSIQPQFTDPQYAPMWKQLIFTQYSQSFYEEILAMSSPVDIDQMMAILFQIVFGLDLGQRNLSLEYKGIDVRKDVRIVKMDPGITLQFQWGEDDFYRFRPGMKVKIMTSEDTELSLMGVRIGGPSPYTGAATESKLSTGSKQAPNFNRDLMRLGATLLKVLNEKQMRTTASSPEIEDAFKQMINRWINCGNSCFGKKYPTSAEIAKQNYRLSCLQGPDATWKSFHDIPSHSESLDAVPFNQKDFFRCFKVNKSDIDPYWPLFVIA
jgi:hypothetical protein